MIARWGAQLALRTIASRSCRRHDGASHSWPSLWPHVLWQASEGASTSVRWTRVEPAPQPHVRRRWRLHRTSSADHNRPSTMRSHPRRATSRKLMAPHVHHPRRPGSKSALHRTHRL